jgi:hypothetical protein
VKKRKKTEPMDQADELMERLSRFLSLSLVEKAGQGLSDRICVAVHVEEQDFFFGRQKGRFTLSRVGVQKPDIHFWVRSSALRQVLEIADHPRTGLASLGVVIFEHIFAKEEAQKIRFRVDTGFLGLWSKGYFSVLKAGGPEVASYLARFGYDGISAIKKVIIKRKRD